jgi:hypothetical protein
MTTLDRSTMLLPMNNTGDNAVVAETCRLRRSQRPEKGGNVKNQTGERSSEKVKSGYVVLRHGCFAIYGYFGSANLVQN